MDPQPSVRHLRHLVALAEHAHFGRAAEACFMTQSSLSASIKELECVLEATLVDRDKRHVVLTPLGHEVVQRARVILAGVAELTHAARASRKPLCGTLRLGAIPTIGPFLLPRVLPKLHGRFAELRLSVVEDYSSRLLASLHQGEIDIALLALPYDCGAVETAILCEDRFIVGMPANHPLAAHQVIEPQQIHAENLILLKDGHCLRDHVLVACDAGERRRNTGFEAASLYTLVQLVENGLGMTLFPTLAIQAGLLRGSNIVTRPLSSKEPSRQVGLVWRQGTGRRREFQVLANELAASIEGNLGDPAAKHDGTTVTASAPHDEVAASAA
jgi:LysR family hydrogen peroxide-inducible transcriptional activator